MKRTRYGLTMTNDSGAWTTLDGSAWLGLVVAVEECENPHPMRDRTYCRGNEPHEKDIGYRIESSRQDLPKDVTSDLYYTVSEAWQTLAKHEPS